MCLELVGVVVVALQFSQAVRILVTSYVVVLAEKGSGLKFLYRKVDS